MKLTKKQHVVIVGAGFGGLSAALKLRKAHVDLTVFDKSNHHLFQPLLYQVAIGALGPSDIATPLRYLLQENQQVDLNLEQVARVDRRRKVLVLEDGKEEHYDTLILAVGNQPGYFGHPEWKQFAPGLKTLSDALYIRERLFLNFEAASRVADPELRKSLLTVVIIGGGPTGVEVAGALSETMRRSIKTDFRNVEPDELRVVLIEGGERLLSTFSPKLSERTLKDMQKLNVEVKLKTFVESITEDGVTAGGQFYPTRNAVWAAGNAAQPLLESLGAERDRAGRVMVTPQLHLPDDRSVFVIGDAGHCLGDNGKPLPGIAQVALQQGNYLGKHLRMGTLSAKVKPFKYKDLGNMATIGRGRAIVELPNGMKLAGYPAWAMWAGVHVLKLVTGRNRMRVFAEWVWYYLTFRPGSRLIFQTGTVEMPKMPAAQPAKPAAVGV